MRTAPALRWLSIAITSAFLPGAAVAGPLDADACQRLAAQRDALEARGVRQLVVTGPPQARSQLSGDQIASVRQLMEIDGQLRFRCPLDRPVAALKEDPPEEQADGTTDAAPAAAKAPIAAKPKKPVAAAAAKPPKSAPAAGADPSATAPPAVDPTAPGKSARPKAAPKRTTSAKTDDAYRAPAEGDPNGTPLNQQIPVGSAQR